MKTALLVLLVIEQAFVHYGAFKWYDFLWSFWRMTQ